jgi:hypothetical protein
MMRSAGMFYMHNSWVAALPDSQLMSKFICLGTQLHENRRTTFSDTKRDHKIEELKTWKKTRRRMTTEEREVANAKQNARKKAKRESMTTEEWEAANAKWNACKKAKRESLSTEEREVAKAKENARNKAKPDSMSTEERKAAKAKDNARKKAKRDSMSTAEWEATNAEKAARKKAKRDSMSTAEREAANAEKVACNKAKLDSMSTEEHCTFHKPSWFRQWVNGGGRCCVGAWEFWLFRCLRNQANWLCQAIISNSRPKQEDQKQFFLLTPAACTASDELVPWITSFVLHMPSDGAILHFRKQRE